MQEVRSTGFQERAAQFIQEKQREGEAASRERAQMQAVREENA